MIFEIWWFAALDNFPKPVYRSAGPSIYGEHHEITDCKVWHGEHVCYIRAESLLAAMAAATVRHPEWESLPVRITHAYPVDTQ